jgi:uncharacterized protein
MITLQYRGRSAEYDSKSLLFQAVTDRNRGHALTSRNRSDSAAAHPDLAADAAIALAKDRRQLDRLVLNVANFCNLDCVYCYAQGGSYGGHSKKMTIANGERAIAKFFNEYQSVATIHFFGGEPLLNLDLIEHLCRYGHRLSDDLGREPPVYMVSTNGTVHSDDACRIVSKFDIKLTVSLDGPPAVMDALRPSRSGAPTGARVEAGIKRLRESTGQPVQVEGTFTAEHLRQGILVRDVLDYVYSNYGICLVHMPVNVLPPATQLRIDPQGIPQDRMSEVAGIYADATANTLHNILYQPPGHYAALGAAVEMLDELVRPHESEHPVICPAGTGTIAVDVDGSVYPCFMFYRQPGMTFGHIGQGKFMRAINSDRQRHFVEQLSRANTERLATSYARRFLGGCAGANYFQQGHHGNIDAGAVELVEAMLAAAIVEVAHEVEDNPGRAGYLPLGIDLLKAFVNAPGMA